MILPNGRRVQRTPGEWQSEATPSRDAPVFLAVMRRCACPEVAETAKKPVKRIDKPRPEKARLASGAQAAHAAGHSDALLPIFKANSLRTAKNNRDFSGAKNFISLSPLVPK
jgi:hypothetical protein